MGIVLPRGFIPKCWKKLAQERIRTYNWCLRMKKAPSLYCCGFQQEFRAEKFYVSHVWVPPLFKTFIGGVKIELINPICIEGFVKIHNSHYYVAYLWNTQKSLSTSETISFPAPFLANPHTKNFRGETIIPIDKKQEKRKGPFTRLKRARVHSKSSILVYSSSI